MKANIFLYPTNEPSQLYRIIGSNDLGKTSNDPYYTENMGGGTQNQYVVVISNDPIKVGDWTLMFDSVGNLFLGHEPQQYLGIEHGHHLNDGLRKIVLSNDPKLTSTGVQPIDEDFLEWLVNNPTCKFIKTYWNPLNNEYDFMFPKKETLEEAAEEYSKLKVNKDGLMSDKQVKDFIAGANWQGERMYNEEEVKKFLIDCKNQFSGGSLEDYHSDSEVVEWFEKNKKKYGKCI